MIFAAAAFHFRHCFADAADCRRAVYFDASDFIALPPPISPPPCSMPPDKAMPRCHAARLIAALPAAAAVVADFQRPRFR